MISFHYDVQIYHFCECYRFTCLDLVVFAGRIMCERPFRPVRSQYFHLTRKQADKIFQKLALFFACFAAGGLGRVACVAAGESLIQHCLLRSISFQPFFRSRFFPFWAVGLFCGDHNIWFLSNWAPDNWAQLPNWQRNPIFLSQIICPSKVVSVPAQCPIT